MWEGVASTKRQQKASWCAVPSVKTIDSLSHSLDPKPTFRRLTHVLIRLNLAQSGNFLLNLVAATTILSSCKYKAKPA